MRLFLILLCVLAVGGLGTYFALSWLGGQAEVAEEESSPTLRAVELAEARGCLACHSLDGSKGIGPTWVGAWGRERSFVDGTTALVDEAYLRRSMQEPAAQVVAGYENVMLPAQFTAEEQELIVNLFRELGNMLPPQ